MWSICSIGCSVGNETDHGRISYRTIHDCSLELGHFVLTRWLRGIRQGGPPPNLQFFSLFPSRNADPTFSDME